MILKFYKLALPQSKAQLHHLHFITHTCNQQNSCLRILLLKLTHCLKCLIDFNKHRRCRCLTIWAVKSGFEPRLGQTLSTSSLYSVNASRAHGFIEFAHTILNSSCVRSKIHIWSTMMLTTTVCLAELPSAQYFLPYKPLDSMVAGSSYGVWVGDASTYVWYAGTRADVALCAKQARASARVHQSQPGHQPHDEFCYSHGLWSARKYGPQARTRAFSGEIQW